MRSPPAAARRPSECGSRCARSSTGWSRPGSGRRTNFYRDGDGAAIAARAARAQYLDSRAEAPILLVGEAPGYRGARVSGIPFTSERQLTGRARPRRRRRSCTRALADFGLADRGAALERRPDASRHRLVEPPADREARFVPGSTFARELGRGRQVVGCRQACSRGARTPRTSAIRAGAGWRRSGTGLLQFAPGGRLVRRFSE